MATDSISVAGSRPHNRPVNARDNDTASASSSPSPELPTGDERSRPSSGVSKELQHKDGQHEEGPPLPEEDLPPLLAKAPPAAAEDDGWAPVWDDNAQAYYFYNRFTGQSQWTNPRVPEAQDTAPGVGNHDRIADTTPTGDEQPLSRPYGGYDPAIHGDYDPTASYAQEAGATAKDPSAVADPNAIYTATGVFNRFTGKWQPATLAPENFNDENKSKRQMSAFFDVDAAANSHNGKSLKAERSGKKLTKQELKAFKEKRREKKEEKRRAWLRD